MNKLVLIDGHSMLNRAFYGLHAAPMTTSDGLHTNAVYGFINIMLRILDIEKADHLAVAFDLSAPTFRHKEYKEYKGTRKPMPPELCEQVPIIKELLSAMDIPILSIEGYEADDIIGTIAKRYQSDDMEVTILTGDRDLLQLSDKHIKIKMPKSVKGKTEVVDYYPEDVKEQHGVTPLEYIDVKALMGDASDNIPGVASIGEKTATAIIQQYHNIENAYEHVDELKPPRASKALAKHYDDAVKSKWLATIKLDVPIEISKEDMKMGNILTPKAYTYMKRLEFKSLLKRFDTDVEIPFENDKWNFTYKLIEDIKELNDISKDISDKTTVGLSLSCIKDAIILSIGYDTGDTYVAISGDDLDNDKIIEVAISIYDKSKNIYIYDLKSFVHITHVKEREDIYDISVMAYLLNPIKDSYNYDDIARDYLDKTLPSLEDMLGKTKISAALASKEESIIKASAYEADIAAISGDIIIDKLKDMKMYDLYIDIERPLTYALVSMEDVGISVDARKLSEYHKDLQKKIDSLEQEIYKDCKEEFNINSPQQLGTILFDKMKMPYAKKTKTGYSTAADILDKLAPDYPFVEKILLYRQLSKLNSTYAIGLSEYISSDGRIHGRFNQTVTATGRISSTEPNLQNIPIRTEMGSRFREVFVPKEGYVFVDADYSQIELRILASMSGDEKLIDAYKHAADIHTATASQVFHVPIDEVTKEMRRNAKAVNFGVVYGISAFGLSEGLSISRSEAKEYIDNYFKTYPGVKSFLDKEVESAKEKGYSITITGRRRPIPELSSSNFMQRQFGERVAMNAPIQGSAADIMKKAMVDVDRKLIEKGLDAKIVLQIHDELLIEVREDEAKKVQKIVHDAMMNAIKIAVDLEIDIHIGKSWFDAK